MNTNIKIEEVRNLLKSGDIAWAEAAVQGLLVAEADNIQTRMLQGRFSAMVISQTGTITETPFCIRQQESERIIKEITIWEE